MLNGLGTSSAWSLVRSEAPNHLNGGLTRQSFESIRDGLVQAFGLGPYTLPGAQACGRSKTAGGPEHRRATRHIQTLFLRGEELLLFRATLVPTVFMLGPPDHHGRAVLVPSGPAQQGPTPRAGPNIEPMGTGAANSSVGVTVMLVEATAR